MKISALGLITLLAFASVGLADPEKPAEPAPIVIAQATPPAEKPVSSEPAKPAAQDNEADSEDETEDDPIEATVSGEYEEDEDSFIPSQEVSSDQSLNFPIDI